MKRILEESKKVRDIDLVRRRLLESGAVRLDSGDGIISESATRALKDLLSTERVQPPR
jgi:hypothetical protein